MCLNLLNLSADHVTENTRARMCIVFWLKGVPQVREHIRIAVTRVLVLHDSDSVHHAHRTTLVHPWLQKHREEQVGWSTLPVAGIARPNKTTEYNLYQNYFQCSLVWVLYLEPVAHVVINPRCARTRTFIASYIFIGDLLKWSSRRFISWLCGFER